MNKASNQTHPVMNLAGFDKSPLIAVLQKFELLDSTEYTDDAERAKTVYDKLIETQNKMSRQDAEYAVQKYVDERRIDEEEAPFYVENYLRDKDATLAVLNKTQAPQSRANDPLELGNGTDSGNSTRPDGKMTPEQFMNKLDTITDPAEKARFYRANRELISQ